jgi:hypothetical protein
MKQAVYGGKIKKALETGHINMYAVLKQKQEKIVIKHASLGQNFVKYIVKNNNKNKNKNKNKRLCNVLTHFTQCHT